MGGGGGGGWRWWRKKRPRTTSHLITYVLYVLIRGNPQTENNRDCSRAVNLEAASEGSMFTGRNSRLVGLLLIAMSVVTKGIILTHTEGGGGERHRERDTERQRERDRDRERDTHRERQRERDTVADRD